MLFCQNGTLNKKYISCLLSADGAGALLFFYSSQILLMEWAHTFLFYFNFLFKRASESEDQGISLVWPWDVCQTSRGMTKHSKWHVVPAKFQISLCIRSVWSNIRRTHEEALGPWLLIKHQEETARDVQVICMFCRARAHMCYDLSFSAFEKPGCSCSTGCGNVKRARTILNS